VSDLIPFTADSLLPSAERRQTRRALVEIERRAAVIEAAAERKIELVTRVGRLTKLNIAAEYGVSSQLKQAVPEAAGALDYADMLIRDGLVRALEKAAR
jgi:hypothetical protein